jgi:hypothetical protein
VSAAWWASIALTTHVILVSIIATSPLSRFQKVCPSWMPRYTQAQFLLVVATVIALGIALLGPLRFRDLVVAVHDSLPPSGGHFLAWILVALLICIATVACMILVSWNIQHTRVSFPPPPRITPSDQLWLRRASLMAGPIEEIVFRGVDLALATIALSPLLGHQTAQWTSMVFLAIFFGAAHTNYPWPGRVLTGTFGIWAGISVIVVGSVVPAIIAHTLINDTFGPKV